MSRPGEPVAPQSAVRRSEALPRNIAVDAYRGFVMVLMMAEVLHLARVARAYPESGIWNFLAYHQSHVAWAGASLHDLIQPSFSFLVGVALPYSLARRLSSGANPGALFAHAVWRSLILVALGIFLRSIGRDQTNFTFEDTLTQIGLGYPFLFLLGLRSIRVQWTALAVVLIGYWLAWALYAPPLLTTADYVAVGVPADWAHHYTGLASHWNKNNNFGHAFDVWFLNLFPRAKAFVANGGGYLTLSFIPTLGTMILGLIAGRWLRDAAAGSPTANAAQAGSGSESDSDSGSRSGVSSGSGSRIRIPMQQLIIAGAIGLAAGGLLHVTGINPVVKRIWTPAGTLYSGGACFLLLAAFCWVIEVRGYRRLAFPLVVVGVNSIAAYLIAHLFEDFIISSFKTHLGANVFGLLGAGLAPFVQGAVVLTVYWLILYWMYLRKLFLRI
jgi:heparan-alpha-glucosaminide N-acetyltransferase